MRICLNQEELFAMAARYLSVEGVAFGSPPRFYLDVEDLNNIELVACFDPEENQEHDKR